MKSIKNSKILAFPRVMAIFLLLFAFPAISYAIQDGDWEGVTDQGLEINFSTSGTTANDITTRLRIYCGGYSVLITTSWGSQPIVDNSFSVMGNAYACSQSVLFKFGANFTDERTCEGYYWYILASSVNGTWQATNISINTPTVTTSPVATVTSSSATSGGDVISDGGADITERGVCWSTSPNPNINDSKTIDGSGIGSYTSEITGLTAGTTYYVRAYATNSGGTGYGADVAFITSYTSTLYVTSNGQCSQDPCYQTIQLALEAAEDGSLIKVGDGVYSESPNWKKSGIVVISGGWQNSFTEQDGISEIYNPLSTGSGSVRLKPNVKVVPQ